MARSTYRDAGETHRTVSAGILDALGRGFLIATAGVVAGVMFGTANLAAMGLWTVGVAAASGVACMVGSVLVRNAGCDPCEEDGGGSPLAVNCRQVTTAVPDVEVGDDVDPDGRWARRIVMSSQERGQSRRRGV